MGGFAPVVVTVEKIAGTCQIDRTKPLAAHHTVIRALADQQASREWHATRDAF
jgi:hypothetical protein